MLAVFLLLTLLLGVAPMRAAAATSGDLAYQLINGGSEVEILPSSMAYGAIVVPATIEGKPVTKIGDSAFSQNTYITSIQLPDSITSIGQYAFRGCLNLKTINLPNTITVISPNAFWSCYELKSIAWPTGCNKIPKGCFSGSGLETIQIPASVQFIEGNPFGGSLKEIRLDSANQYFIVENSTLFNKDKTRLISHCGHPFYENSEIYTKFMQYAMDRMKDTLPQDEVERELFYMQILYDFCATNASVQYSIPATVQDIGENAFSGQLVSTAIPNGLKKFGEHAFGNCFLGDAIIPAGLIDFGDALEGAIVKSFTVDPANPIVASQAGMLMDKSKSYLLHYPAYLPQKNVILPNTLLGVNEDTFIGLYAETLTIPQQVNDISSDDWKGLKSMRVKDYLVDSANPYYTTVDGVLFSKDLKTLALYPSKRLYNSTARNYVIPNGTVAIGAHSLSCNYPFNDLVIPNTVKRIEEDGIYVTKSLTIPTSVEYLGRNAIDIWKPSSITIPREVLTLEENALPGGWFSTYLNGNGMWVTEQGPRILVYCYKDSAAHQYAQENEHPFILIDQSVTKIDTVTGISVEYNEGTYPSNNVSLRVQESNDGAISQWIANKLKPTNKMLYNIDVLVNGVAQQPSSTSVNGKVVVRIPVPNGFDQSNAAVYRVITENPLRLENMKATVIDGCLVFAVDHFSYYAIVENRSQGQQDDPILPPVPLVLSKAETTLNPRHSEKIFATGNSSVVSWRSSNEKVATVSSDGTILAKSRGTTTITASTESGQSATMKVTVKYSFWQWLLVIFLFGWIWVPLK